MSYEELSDFTNAKIGDKVWSITKGWDEIISTTGCSEYPLHAKFKTTIQFYTLKGKYSANDLNAFLFKQEMKIVPLDKVLPIEPNLYNGFKELKTELIYKFE